MAGRINTGGVDKERVRLLVEALRSGEFEQGKNYLKNHNGKMCCLGVACIVAKRNDCDVVEWRNYIIYLGAEGDFDAQFLPIVVRKWYGFEHANPRLYTANGSVTGAVELNDVDGYDFLAIADAFERTYLQDGELDESNS